nr:hypothetical protein [Tanacetum cinerariifolium]
SIDCLPNEEIFTELSRIGYEKPSTKLTFYKVFFSSQRKAQVSDLSLHSTKYSSPALTQKVFANMRRVGKGFFGVDTPLFEGMIVAQQDDDIADEGAASVAVDDVHAAADEPIIPSPTPTTQPPPPSQDLPSTSQQRVNKLERRNKLKVSKLRRLKRVGPAQRVDTSDDTIMDDVSKQGRIIASMDANVDDTLKDVADIANEVAVDVEIEESADVQGRQAESQAQIYQIDLEHADKVLSMHDNEMEPAELQEVVEVVSTAKLMTKVVTAASATITNVDTLIPAATITVVALTLTTTPSAARRRKEVVIRDPEETATPSIIIHSEPKSKDNGKRILVEDPKPLKKQAWIKQDEAFARELEAELNKIINWDDVIDQEKRKEKEDNVVMRYQTLKRKPQTEAQARKNMMIYLRNMAGFKMDYFKGMKYNDIRPIFKRYFNSNVSFLEKTKEQMEEEDSRALKRANASQEEKATKRQKLDEEVAELKRHLQLVPAPTEGYEDAIVVPAINADNFNLKHGLLTLVQNKQFFGYEKEDPHAHIRYFNKITSTLNFPNILNTSIKLTLFPFSLEGAAQIWLEKEPPRSIFTWDDLVSKFINQFFPPSKTTNLHTFYNALNSKDQDLLNSADGGNFLDKMPRECLAIIESKSKVFYSRNKPVVAKVSMNTSTFGISPDVAKLKDMVKALLLDKKSQNQSPAIVKAVEESCVNDGDSHSYRNCPATDGNVYRDNIENLVVKNEPEATKDTEHPTNNESTEDVQPLVVQSKYVILTSEPVNSLTTEPAISPVSAPRPNLRPSIPYPSRMQDQRLRDKANANVSIFSKSSRI